MVFKAITLYIFLINLVAYITMGIDKKKSQKGKWRIKEKSLLCIALFGGAIGIYWGMKKFHHKTKKTVFKIGVPLLLILNGAIYLLVFYYII